MNSFTENLSMVEPSFYTMLYNGRKLIIFIHKNDGSHWNKKILLTKHIFNTTEILDLVVEI